jgi:phage terminase large subunit-like protein
LARPKLPPKADLVGSLCRTNFERFVREFWSCLPGVGKLVWNWHLGVICQELQKAALRVFENQPKEYDLLFNVPPGTSKSSIISILFPAWVWTNFPTGRFICASHTESLVLDLAKRSRLVIQSEKYRELFPGVGDMEQDRGAVSDFANKAGGERKGCTVGGVPPHGRHAHVVLIDDPIDPQKVLSEAGLRAADHFQAEVIPTRVVSLEVSLIVTVMQRLGLGDPSDVVLRESRKEGGTPVRHICLPAELTDTAPVHPPELVHCYVNKLLDPVRLSPRALKPKKTNALFYSTQYLQLPYAKKGGRFEELWFSHRCKAAPYVARRVRYIDLARTEDGGCFTSMVLMAKDDEGFYYVEDVTRGQWGPLERDNKIYSIALRDRSRYGPRHEPTVVIEQEPAAGKDVFMHLARKLAGFRVVADDPRALGRKEARAEPWASQLAAGNVLLVDNGEAEGGGRATWDIKAYVDEHLAFPNAVLKDQVDASSGAFHRLAGAVPAGTLRIFRLAEPDRKTKVRVVVCSEQELGSLNLEQKCLLFTFVDPPPAPEEVMPSDGGSLPGEDRAGNHPGPDVTVAGGESVGGSLNRPALPGHSLDNLLGSHRAAFADLDPAEVKMGWEDPLPGYGRPPGEVLMTQAQGRQLWGFLLRKWPAAYEILIFCDKGGGDRRAASAALAVVDVLRLPRNVVLYKAGDPDFKYEHTYKPPNRHVYDRVKGGRHALAV